MNCGECFGSKITLGSVLIAKCTPGNVSVKCTLGVFL